MPVGIDAEAQSLVGLGVIGGDRAVVFAQQGGTMLAAYVETHIGGIAAIEAMTIDATFELGILNQRPLIERGEIAFVDAHLAPHFIAWLNQTVAEAIVDAVRADVDGEWLVGVPAVIVLGRDCDAERVARVGVKQGVPVIKVEVCRLVALGVQTVSVAVGNDGINKLCRLISHVKADRSNVHGYGDTNVVRIDMWQRGLLLGILNSLIAAHQSYEPH